MCPCNVVCRAISDNFAQRNGPKICLRKKVKFWVFANHPPAHSVGVSKSLFKKASLSKGEGLFNIPVNNHSVADVALQTVFLLIYSFSDVVSPQP